MASHMRVLELVGDPRRGAGLHAKHPCRLWRWRSHSRASPKVPPGSAAVPDLVPVANTGRSADLDSIATYLAVGVRAPISPIRESQADGPTGPDSSSRLQGCQNCHGGPNWTISAMNFTPRRQIRPPQIVDAQLIDFLCRVGTFDATLFTDGVSNEIKANQANVAVLQARGVDGFNTPSLISVFASAPYLHSGAAATIDDLLDNVTHRTAGRPDGFDFLQFDVLKSWLVDFVRSIDRSTAPFFDVTPPTDICGPQP